MSFEERIIKVPGQDKGKIFIFALSTCVWCKKTKQLLNDLGVMYDYIDVDLVSGNAEQELMDEFKKYTNNISFPTIIIEDGQEVITGFDEARIKELFENGK
ncbi:MAG: glutaredoxin family protein [Candidatus Berkelbacteria bacterium]